LIGIVGMLLMWAMAALIIYTGSSLRARKRPTLCKVMACLVCLNVPLGTALGVWTLVVLGRDSVRRLFDGGSA
jgi:hypothetical protein